jgi:glycosyltransferase involved in cell wall biosynthesis
VAWLRLVEPFDTIRRMVAVSVLMPVFSGEKYLSAAVESILSQTFGDFEFLVLDDGSTDSTLDILRAYSAQDQRLRVISRGNKGLVASLNELLGQARGEFVARMDADDIALPHRLSRQVQFLRDHVDVVCVGGSVEVIDEKARFLTTFRYPKSDEEIQERNLLGDASICHPSAMMRRDALIRIEGYDGDFFLAEDLDLWLRLGEIGKLANLDEVVLRYRFHSKSLSEKGSIRQLEVARAACERAWQRRGIQGVFSASPWRPGPSRASRHEHIVKCGWWAWKSGQRRTAAIYALRAVGEWPTHRAGWVLLACSLCRPLKRTIDSLRLIASRCAGGS